MTRSHADDQRWMRAALLNARYGAGRTAPNPSVGCVIIKDNLLIGSGRTADGGRPHAETQALKDAGAAARGATAYVTLEPCSHHGKTPPCADALVESGISRVVVGALDPDANVSGQGIKRLTAAGIDVETGIEGEAVSHFYRGYFYHRRTGLPFVTAKIASTLDGKIALADGRSKWITGGRTRQFIHLMRAQHDAMLTSSGTSRADNPSLTARIDGYDGPQPLRVMASSQITLDDDSNFARTLDQAGVLILGTQAPQTLPEGVEHEIIPADPSGYPDLTILMQTLGARGIISVMVEAGGQFLSSLLKAGLIHQLVWTRSSGVIGGEGRPSLADLGLGDLSEGRIFKRISSTMIEDDAIETYINSSYLNS